MNKDIIDEIWQRQELPSYQRFSIDDIKSYKENLSTGIVSSRLRLIRFDSITKTVVMTGYIALLFIGNFTILKLGLTGLVVIGGILLILRNRKLRNKINRLDTSKDVLGLLIDKYTTINQYYNEFILSYSFTNPFLVLAGFQFYQLYKYHADKLDILLTDPVIYLFLLAAFLVSYLPQRVLYTKELKELEYILDSKDDETSEKIQMIRIKQRRRLYVLVFTLIALIGIGALLTILFMLR